MNAPISTMSLPTPIAKGLEFKKRLRDGEKLVGAWSTLGSANIAYLMARGGLDFIVIDLEHGVAGADSVQPQVQALLSLPTAVIVRLADHAEATIKRVLDAGANGILCPMVNSAEAAQTLVSASMFPERGTRGVAVGAIPASDFGYLGQEYFNASNDATTVLVQIESPRAVEQLEEIMAVPGLDGLFVGPMDLSSSLGAFRDFDSAGFKNAMNKVESYPRRHGCVLGAIPYGQRTSNDLLESGYQFVIAGSDQAMLRKGALDLVAGKTSGGY